LSLFKNRHRLESLINLLQVFPQIRFSINVKKLLHTDGRSLFTSIQWMFLY